MFERTRWTTTVTLLTGMLAACAGAGTAPTATMGAIASPTVVPPTVVPTESITGAVTESPPTGVQQTVAATPMPVIEPVIGLQLAVEGLTAPVAFMPSGDGTGRLFILDQVGQIWILLPEGQLTDEPFLDISDRMVDLSENYDERGLLGLAFHPSYADNGRFFVYYSAPLRAGGPSGWDNTSHVSQFVVSADDANKANKESERILLQVDQPQANHAGGQITFGPDGYLYIPLGDGGAANDVGVGHNPDIGNGQDTAELLGSILRIDVDNGDPYGIPTDNPFVGTQSRQEIWAYGLRNPYRIAFDAGGGRQLFAGDAGQNLWEEVNLVTRGGNYGWNLKEGTHCFDPGNPSTSPPSCVDTGRQGEVLIDPIIEYPNASGNAGGLGMAVVGGMVYRGNALTAFQGRYIFGDWSIGGPNGTLLIATPPASEGAPWPFEELRVAGAENERMNHYLLSFGQDADLELYILVSDRPGPSGNTGRVFKVVPPAG